MTLVDTPREAPGAAVASLFEGYPLAAAMPAIEAAALGLAVRGRNEQWDGLRWLYLLNEVDPAATALELRKRSAEIAARVPEAGINPGIARRAAALLLWLIGDASDDAAAAAVEPGFDRAYVYERDYLPDPGRSPFPLERRHADAVLLDGGMSVYARVRRLRDLWLDPTYEPPAAFVRELADMAEAFDVGELDHATSRTPADVALEDMEPALARCVPHLLASLLRRKLSDYARRPAAARYWSAIHATDNILLVEGESLAAFRTMRMASTEPQPSEEFFARTQLLIAEAAELGGMEQRELLLAAGLDAFLVEWGVVLEPIDAAASDELVRRHGAGDGKPDADLAALFALGSARIGEEAWDWLFRKALEKASGPRAMAFQVLAEADGSRFGRELWDRGWTWSPEGDVRVNHYGGIALIEASVGLPFDQVVPRLAPWLLALAAAKRGGAEGEVRVAAGVLDAVVSGPGTDVPDLGVAISIDRTIDANGPGFPSARFDRPPIDWSDSGGATAALDPEAVTESRLAAIDLAVERIAEARRSGATLYLVTMGSEGFEDLCRHAPDVVARWIDGAATLSLDFRRRLLRAEGLFLALCEALLVVDPPSGATLWRAIRRIPATGVVGEAGVDELIHQPFRAPRSPSTDAILEELLSLDVADTDARLRDLAAAAVLAGRRDWLDAAIARDAASDLAWRRARSGVLSSHVPDGPLNQPGAWPEGWVATDAAKAAMDAARARLSAAASAHWWRKFVDAADKDTAYAAWVLATRSADRTALARYVREGSAMSEGVALGRRKRVHVSLNARRVRAALEKREKALDGTYLGRRTVEGVGPWGKVRP